jgi:hypothetical protein
LQHKGINLLYLIDANTLINAKRDYYQLKRVPEYWSWINHLGNDNKIKIPKEIYDEFKDVKQSDGTMDELAEWASQKEIKQNLIIPETIEASHVTKVLGCYGNNLNESELKQIGKDPFLVACALSSPEDRIVVTAEVSAPRKQRQNRKVPDICSDLGIRCVSPFEMINLLDFTTDWNSKI